MKFKSDIEVQAGLKDSSGAAGSSGQILSSTGSGVSWVNQISLSGYVPYIGATTNLNMGNFYISASEYKFLDPAYSVYGRLFLDAEEFTFMTTPTSTVAAITYGQLLLQTPSVYSATITYTTLTDNRTYALPNASGTLALTSNIPSVSGTTNYVPKFTGATSLGNSLIYDNGTNVGIGTTMPSSPLEVNGAIVSKGGGIGGLNGTIGLGDTGTSLSGNALLGEMYFKTGGTEKMRINISGNVGIGTTSPSAMLTLNSITPFIRLERAGVPTWQIQNNTIVATAGFSINNITNGTTPFFINGTNDNVGIGTGNPSSLLEIAGSAPILTMNRTSGSFTNTIDFKASGNPVGSIISNSAIGEQRYSIGPAVGWGGYHTFYTDTSEKMRITSSGNVGIGTTSPTNPLHILKGANSFILDGLKVDRDPSTTSSAIFNAFGGATNIVSNSGATSTFSPITFRASDNTTTNELMRITGSGNVGIGTSSPATKLQVEDVNKVFDGYGNINVFTTDTAATNIGGSIAFGGKNSSGGTSPYPFAKIQGVKEGSAGNYNGALLFGTTANSSAVIERMRIDSTGNIGIGTTSPGYKLDVNGSFFATSIATNGLLRTSDRLYILGDTAISSWISSSLTAGYSATNSYGWINSANNIILGTDGSERIRINSSGNVGIGMTTPSEKLTVAGNGIFYNSTTSWAPSTAAGLFLSGSSSGGASFISTYLDTSTLQIGAGVSQKTGFIINGQTSGLGSSIDFRTGGGSKMFLNSSGNLGIGTTSPISLLHINIPSATANALTVGNNNNGAIYGCTTSGDPIIGAYTGSLPIQFGYFSGGISTTFVERMRITSTGNIEFGKGLNSPKVFSFEADTTGVGSSLGGFQWKNTQWDSNTRASINAITDTALANGALLFSTGASNSNATERMRLTSSGNVLIGTTTTIGSGQFCVNFNSSTSITEGINIRDKNLVAIGPSYIVFRKDDDAVIGSISRVASTSAVAYNTTSDYRLKEDLKEIKGLDLISKIKVYDFKWKDSESRMDGVIAHELQEVIPYAVTGEKDGKEMQSVDYSKLVPILVQAIQDQQKQIEELKQLINK